MTKGDGWSDRLAELRKRAEAGDSREAKDFSPQMSPDEAGKLVHELRTHQIELEMQNEELRRAQEELVESHAKYFNLYDIAPVGYVTISLKGLILESNLALADMLGVERRFLSAQLLSAFIVPDNQDIYYKHRRGITASNLSGVCEIQMLRRDAKPFWAEMKSILVAADDEAEAQLLTVVTDISEGKRLELALRGSEQHYRAIAGVAPVGIFHSDAAGGVTFVNEKWCQLGGISSEAAMGNGWKEAIHPDDLDEVSAQWYRSVRTKKRFESEHRYVDAEGATTWCFVQSLPVLSEAGEIVGHVGALTDITERKQAEEQLRQAQKMEAVGQLTGGLAHDFNNLLAIIMGNSELLLERPETEGRLLQPIIRAAERGAKLTHQLLAFSRKQTLEPRAIDLGPLIDEMGQMLRRTLGEQIEMTITPEPGLWQVLADPSQVENALLNLALNARRAMTEGGSLRIESSNVTLDEEYAASRLEVIPGDFVQITVSDTGSGMSAEVLARALEPFFTTKKVGEGSGLGLPMVYGFAKQSRGDLAIMSEEGQGTTVSLYLPRTAKVTDRAQLDGKTETPLGHGETVLVVEDEADVRVLVEAVLVSLGYRALMAKDGREGLAALDNEPTIDLLLSDVVLPGGMSGPDLAVEAKSRSAGLKVLFMSGYAESMFEHASSLVGGLGLLHKPFRRLELAQKVRAALESAPN
ncbi:MAG: PAS domain S-box protein [Proteobacteria bacterium]|nr:PAS domain S-box protein [Pseudomonadota bacterium]